MSRVETLMDRLRRETDEHHRKIEALPFFEALMGETLLIRCYVGLLKSMAVVNGVLESALSHSKHPVLASVWRENMRKLPLLQADLASFEGEDLSDILPVTTRTLEFAARVREWSASQPLALLGCLYVLEGSMLGSKVLRDKVARILVLQRQAGLQYMSKYDSNVTDQWRGFAQRMNAARLNENDTQMIVHGAQSAFEGIGHIVEVLYPFEEAPTPYQASILNPDAGTHHISHDPRELLAALDAGEKSWKAYPYFQWRYGERGRRFTRSDSAWLVTLSGMRPEIMDQQVHWLGRLLSVRGMPRILLEHHLHDLCEALVQAVPEREHRYVKLAEAAGGLRKIRHQYIDEYTFESLSTEFHGEVGHSWSERLPGTGKILVSAVVDEMAGIDRAVQSLITWMTDSSRFPEPWISAVHNILAKARSHTA